MVTKMLADKEPLFDEEKESFWAPTEKPVLSEKSQLCRDRRTSTPGTGITNNDVLDNHGYGRYQWLLAFCCALSRAAALSHIFLGTAVVSNQNVYWKLSVMEDRMVYTVLAVFCLFGSMIGGKFADIYGRKQLLVPGTIVASVVMIIGAITPHYYLFIVCDVVAGVAIGSNLATSTCLYGELVPNTCRSFAVLVLNVMTFGLNLVICVVLYCLLSNAGWRWHYGLVAIPNLLAFAFTLFFVDESPRYYGVIGHTEGQLYVLAHIKSTNNPAVSFLLDEENLKSTTTTERGTWKELIFRFFAPTLASSVISLTVNAITTMLTFSLPIMISADYCSLGAYAGGETGGNDKLEYLLLSILYTGLISGSIFAHYLSNRYSRRYSLYILFGLILLSFLPQMKCISSSFLLVGCILTIISLGGVLHVLTLCVIEMFPTYVRATAIGVVYAVAFVGSLYGPYVGVFINAGSLKSVYLMFCVLTATIFVLVNRGVINTEKLSLFENKEDLNRYDNVTVKSER